MVDVLSDFVFFNLFNSILFVFRNRSGIDLNNSSKKFEDLLSLMVSNRLWISSEFPSEKERYWYRVI